MLCDCQHSGVDLMGLKPGPIGLLFLQCFDTVGWVFSPIKPVPDMTYNVFGGTLNPAQLNSTLSTLGFQF